MLPTAERLLDCFPASIALLDPQGRIQAVNQAWRRIGAANGLADPMCCVGANYLEVCDRAAGAEPTAARVASGIRALAAGGPEFQLEYPCHGPSRQRWFRVVATLVPARGQAWVMTVHDDVTQHFQAALALQDSETRLQLALAAGGMGTWDVDLRTGAESWNEVHYRLFGVDPASFTPSSAAFSALLDPRDRDRVQSIAEDVLAGRAGPDFTNDYRVVLPDGATRWMGGGGRLLRDADGRPERLLGVSFDITERKERELRLEAATQAKSEFLAAMSHEIRTPLTGVLGMADLLAAAELPEKERRYVEAIRTSGRHLLSVINDILDFSRIEAGKLDLERVDFSLPEILEGVRSLMAPQCIERGLSLGFELGQQAPQALKGDPTRLRQVLLNLVGNGLKFTHQGGVAVRVGTCAEEVTPVRLRFEVRDTGIGIPLDKHADLFADFTQADRSTSRTYGGSGLGLAICKRLVEAMAGTIGVESEPGRGSCFWFELPCEPGDASLVAQRNAVEPASIRPMRVLVVDDVAANRDILQAMLGRHGHEVLLAQDGAAALELAARERPDVVLMDVQMPVVDGPEATRRIRRLPPPAGGVPILALTANVMAAERERYLAAGMNLCLTKPVVWPDLFAALAQIAAGGPEPPPAGGKSGTGPDLRAVPLLDLAMLEGMARSLPSTVLHGLLERGLDGAGESCSRLAAALADSGTLAQEAHRLRGTAGTFGLARVSALAAAIEDRVGRGEGVAELVAELDEVIHASRDAIARLTFGAWAPRRLDSGRPS